MKKLIFGTLGLLSALLFVGICIRFAQASAPFAYRKPLTTPAIDAAQDAGMSISVERQTLRSYITEFGYFHCDYIDYISPCNEVQMTVWYNHSTQRKIAEKYGTQVQSGMPFTFDLVDEQGNVYQEYTILQQCDRGRYTFLRISFAQIVPQQVQQLTIRFYEKNTIEEPLTTLLFYHAQMQRKPVTLK